MKPPVSDVKSGIDRVVELFKTFRLYVFEDLAGLRDELMTYSRVLDRITLEPTEEIKDKNKYHRLDSLRYVSLVLPAPGDVAIDPQAGYGANPWSFISPPSVSTPLAPAAPSVLSQTETGAVRW
jgi:hypothetical protein